MGYPYFPIAIISWCLRALFVCASIPLTHCTSQMWQAVEISQILNSSSPRSCHAVRLPSLILQLRGKLEPGYVNPQEFMWKMNSENCTLWEKLESQLSSWQGTEAKCKRQINHNKASLILHFSKPLQLMLSWRTPWPWSCSGGRSLSLTFETQGRGWKNQIQPKRFNSLETVHVNSGNGSWAP